MSLLYIKFDNSHSHLAFPAAGGNPSEDPNTGIKLIAFDANAPQNFPPVMVGSHIFDYSNANQNAFTQQKTLTQFSIRPGRLLLSHYTVSYPSNRVINHLAQEPQQITVAYFISSNLHGGGQQHVTTIDPLNVHVDHPDIMDKNYGDLYVHLPWIENDIASTDHFGGLVLPVDKSKTFYSASPMLELKTDTERIPKVFEMTVQHTNGKPFLGELNLYFSYVD